MITERMKFNSSVDYSPQYYFWRTYDGQEIDLLEVNSHQEMQGLEFKWGNRGKTVPAAFARAYPAAQWNEVSKESYFEWIV